MIALLLLALAGPAFEGVAEAPTDPRYRSQVRTEHVIVRSDWDEEALLERLARELETALPIFARETGFSLPAKDRLVLNLFATQEAYAEVSQADGAAPTPATGLTLIATSQSYVIVQPTLEPAYLEAVGGLPDGLLELVLHEAVHQYVMRAHDEPERILPGWFIEGRAEHIARVAMRELLGSPERDPLCLASSTNKVALAIEAGTYMPLDAVFGTSFKVPRTWIFYEQAESLFGYLSASDSPYHECFVAFRRWLATQRAPEDAREPFHGPLEGIDERWQPCVGSLDDFEKDWTKAMSARVGDWHEFWRHSQWVGDELLCASNHWTTYSLVLHNDPPAKKDFVIETELSFLYGSSACVVVGLEKDPLSFALVQLSRDGVLTVLEFESGGWKPVLNVHGGMLEPGYWTSLRVVAGPMSDVDGANSGPTLGTSNGDIADRPTLAIYVDDELRGVPQLSTTRDLGAKNWGLGTHQAGVRYRNIEMR